MSAKWSPFDQQTQRARRVEDPARRCSDCDGWGTVPEFFGNTLIYDTCRSCRRTGAAPAASTGEEDR